MGRGLMDICDPEVDYDMINSMIIGQSYRDLYEYCNRNNLDVDGVVRLWYNAAQPGGVLILSNPAGIKYRLLRGLPTRTSTWFFHYCAETINLAVVNDPFGGSILYVTVEVGSCYDLSKYLQGQIDMFTHLDIYCYGILFDGIVEAYDGNEIYIKAFS